MRMDNSVRFKKYPFERPWMQNNGAANTEEGSAGIKGICFGGITGGITTCLLYPTEFVKTQLQLDDKSLLGGTKKYSGIVDCVRKTVGTNGFFGLYHGLNVVLYGSIPITASRFGIFEFLKKMTVDDEGHLDPEMRAVCGLGAGVCEAIIAVTPVESIKVKFINDSRSSNPRFKGFSHGVSSIIKADGIRGIYQGLTATILKQGSNQAIRFFVIETCKDYYCGGQPSKPVPTFMVGLFGIIAGAISVFANTPLDVVKTRMQGLEAARYSNTKDCFVKIWKNEGPFALYKGTLARLSGTCLDVAISFMIYDYSMKLFNQIWP